MAKDFDIYKMKLHDEYDLNGSLRITKVPDGWIYTNMFFEPSDNDAGRKMVCTSAVLVPDNRK